MGQKYKYDISVIMPVYNVEAYIREAADSVTDQTLDFSRIQLIMVDDGSTDGSGTICDEYQEMYPENVTVIHKKNGGLASARNAGLPYVEGRFFNFLDSDDKLSPEAFSEVFQFFSSHEDETDVCTIPVYYFEAWEGEHWQNYKFDSGSRVISLLSEYDNTLMFVNASFYKHCLKDRIWFDSHLVCGEDMKANLGILMEKMTIGVVASARYYYRRRQNESNPSLIQRAKKKKGFYDDYFTYLTDWAFHAYKDKFGFVPLFVQNEIMSDLQWRINGHDERIMLEALDHSEEEVLKYKARLYTALLCVEDRIILGMRKLSDIQKYAMLRLKHGKEPDVVCSDGDAVLRYGDTVAGRVSEMDVVWEFLTIDPEKGSCTIEGHFMLYGMNAVEIIPLLFSGSEAVNCVMPSGGNPPRKWLTEDLYKVVRFKAEILHGSRSIEIHPAVSVNGYPVRVNRNRFGQFFPVSEVYRNAAAYIYGRKVCFKEGALRITPKPGWGSRTAQEIRLIAEIWKKNLMGGRKAIIGRLLFHFLYPFKRKHIWIISDRFNKADDNGEILFRYIQDHRSKDIRAVFAIRKDSSDYQRLKETGPCVDAMTWKHKVLFLLADFNISSQADAFVVNPFSGHHESLRDLLIRQKFVFLQHGITQNDLSGWLRRQNKNIAGFVTAAKPEYRSIVEGKYDYPESTVWLTGFPRFDRLYSDEKKIITLAPTWRRYLMSIMDENTSRWYTADVFENSDYCRFYRSLLNSERLLMKLKETGYTLSFFPHPNVRPYIDRFHCGPEIYIFPEDTSYAKVYAESSLMVTDYSSVVFDFAYLRKPVVYLQFDKDKFFDGSHVFKAGYFDYEENGFGEVLYDLKSAEDCIIEYMEQNCKLKEQYRKRINEFFCFDDRNNCSRVLEKIEGLSFSR